MDTTTLKAWIEKRGFDVKIEGLHLLRVAWSAPFADKRPLPPLFVQVTDNWVVLSVLQVEVAPAYALVGLMRSLLHFNRKMRLAKFAFGEADEVVLCAELPTESLDEPELASALDVLLDSLKWYGDYGQKLHR
ncbi:MAG: CesT family type III secretion system chaperone [Polyangiaceae bacterium]|nr:CesT family type III secretion system chaperone [Polyangiaceae bacterium]